MTQQTVSVDGRKGQTGAYKDKSKPVDIRSSNINAAKGRSIVKCIVYPVLLLFLFNTSSFMLDLIERVLDADTTENTDAHNLKFQEFLGSCFPHVTSGFFLYPGQTALSCLA